MIKNAGKRPVLRAFFISAIYIVFCLFCGAVWEGNDDIAIADLLSISNSDFCLFNWKILTVVIHWLYVYVPVVEWWGVCHFFALWMYAFAVSYVMIRRYPKWKGYAFICVLLLFSWKAAVCIMNFTRTSAAVAIGGCLLMADAILQKEHKSPVEYFLGCILFLFGAAIRYESAFIAMGYLAIIGGLWLVSQNFSLTKDWFSEYRRQIIGLSITALIFLLCCAGNSVLMTEEEQRYADYNTLRSNIQDYVDNYPTFEEAQDVYQEIGYDAHSLDLLLHWFSEDTEIMTEESLEQIGQLRTYRFDYYAMKEMIGRSAQLIQILGIFLLSGMISNRKNCIYMILVAAFTGCCFVLFSYSGRLVSRVVDAFLLCAICSAAFLGSYFQNIGSTEKIVCVHRIASGFALAVSLLSCLICIGQNWRWGAQPWQRDTTVDERQITMDIIDNDRNHLYLYDIDYPIVYQEKMFSFWESRPVGYCENYIALGGWEARHPDKVAVLKAYGIENPVRALIEREDTYGTYSPRLLMHLRENYCEDVSVSELFQINTIPIVKYTAPIADPNPEVCGISINDLKFTLDMDHLVDGVWYLSADVISFTGDCPVVYCNITVEDSRITYRLHYQSGKVFAYLYGLSEDFDPSVCEPIVFQNLSGC